MAGPSCGFDSASSQMVTAPCRAPQGGLASSSRLPASFCFFLWSLGRPGRVRARLNYASRCPCERSQPWSDQEHRITAREVFQVQRGLHGHQEARGADGREGPDRAHLKTAVQGPESPGTGFARATGRLTEHSRELLGPPVGHCLLSAATSACNCGRHRQPCPVTLSSGQVVLTGTAWGRGAWEA